MSKYLDKDGLAHLWERIQQLVATCGGGGNYKSETLQIVQPNQNGYLYPSDRLIMGHDAFTLDPNVSQTGVLEIGTVQKASPNAVAVVLQGISSMYNGVPFDKIEAITYNAQTRMYRIRFRSDTSLSFNANDIRIEAVEFLYGDSHNFNACVLVGDCSSDDGGGDIAV